MDYTIDLELTGLKKLFSPITKQYLIVEGRLLLEIGKLKYRYHIYMCNLSDHSFIVPIQYAETTTTNCICLTSEEVSHITRSIHQLIRHCYHILLIKYLQDNHMEEYSIHTFIVENLSPEGRAYAA